MAFRNHTLTMTWVLGKNERYDVETDHKCYQVRHVGISNTYTQVVVPPGVLASDAPQISTNVHLSGVEVDPKTGKKIKGRSYQDNLDNIEDLPNWIKREWDQAWRARSAVWSSVQFGERDSFAAAVSQADDPTD